MAMTARDLLRRHAPDPLRDLLEDASEALAAAENDSERRAIRQATSTAFDRLGLAADDDAVKALDAFLNPPAPEQHRVFDRARGRSVSADDLIAEVAALEEAESRAKDALRAAGRAADTDGTPESYEALAAARQVADDASKRLGDGRAFARVVDAVRSADDPATASELLAQAFAADVIGRWDETQLDLLEGVRVMELNGLDGLDDRIRQAQDAKLDAAYGEAPVVPDSPIQRMIAEQIAADTAAEDAEAAA